MQGKKIIIGVTGSIAAYKAASLIRLLIKKGAEVKVLLTPHAQSFISALTLSTLSKNPVYSDVISEDAWNNHVELGLWADLMIIAPTTASTLSKLAQGQSDNIITAVYLSARCPVWIAPAMDLDMWTHPATQRNIKSLESYGNRIIDVEHGELASGLVGKGRMAEPENIVQEAEGFFLTSKDLHGKKVLITAGPTHESLDPVRHIGNKSTGKMGMSLAEECAKRGAEVNLILGPSQVNSYNNQIKITRVISADNMFQTAKTKHSTADIVIFTAAVADYKPKHVSIKKIKKKGDDLTLELERTIDIAKTLGAEKKTGQIHIGFALETNSEEDNAKAKLSKKNFDMIVLNSLNDKGAGFQHDTNKITIYTSDGEEKAFTLKSKSEVAEDIVNTITRKYVSK